MDESRTAGGRQPWDAKAFLGTWGEQAAALGWSNRDLFGLHTPPEQPHPSYSRLSRYDETGLLWLLQGRKVMALTETTAAIENPTGNITVYRKERKPVNRPVRTRMVGGQGFTAVRANDLTDCFPLIVEALTRLRSRSCIIDGEAVCCSMTACPG